MLRLLTSQRVRSKVATVDTENEIYTFTGQDWAGWANNADIYPISFEEGGTITFTASAATPTNVRFRFEYQPYPNVDPAYDTETVLVNSAEPMEYTIEIPSQGTNTFSSFVMYIVERDQPVYITNVVVSSGASAESGSEPGTDGGKVADFSNGCFRVEQLLILRTRSTPSQVKTGLAGRMNDTSTSTRSHSRTVVTITFTASAAARQPTVRFRFEKNPYPDTLSHRLRDCRLCS